MKRVEGLYYSRAAVWKGNLPATAVEGAPEVLPPAWAVAARMGWRLKMFDGFQKIVEERIRIAQKKGQFDNLEGRGKPLPRDVIGDTVPEDLRLSYRILKNADCVPPPVELKHEIRRTEDLLAGMHETREKYGILKKLNFLIVKLNAMRQGRVELEVPQHYADRLVTRMSPKPR